MAQKSIEQADFLLKTEEENEGNVCHGFKPPTCRSIEGGGGEKDGKWIDGRQRRFPAWKKEKQIGPN